MFLDLEEPCAHMHVGGVLVFEGGAPSHADLLAHITARLDRVPRYRQRLAFVPFQLGRPIWVDDASLDVATHVRRSLLPSPGGAGALRERAARFFAEPLDLRRPLWQLELVEGLGPDRFALLSKTHHCLLDGIGGVDFLLAITDATRAAPAAAERAPWRPRPAPGPVARLVDALRDQVARPVRLAREALEPGTEGRSVLRDLVLGARPLARLALGLTARRWPLDTITGPGRSWAMPALSLADAQEVRATLGGTVNDVLLAVVAGAARTLLVARGDAVPDAIRVFVPVNVRPEAARGTYGNQVALVLCPLPLGEPDPVARLRRISEATRRLKADRQATGVLAFTHLGELAPALVAGEAIRIVLALHPFNLVVSNIPGPPAARWLLGRRLAACHPAIPLARGQSLSVGLFSYAGTIGVGLLGGAERERDLAVLSAAIPAALAELVAAARAVAPARGHG
ncbi:diacylglycerol O-acyltransferase [Anaeromyxobacter oryzae]|uniref:diacylglycerol O-acyltransferase n=2 Tax=Anaeromyxobacter oryzae TaxID=2918170 RepID=A0ABM7X027_9BACT|nr:diacylglycerol O-acyltransferase [Anaeromyxobacter oryzae]